MLLNKLTGRLARGKAQIACDVLCELGLILVRGSTGEVIYRRAEGVRAELDNSEILKKLKEGDLND